MDLVTLGKIKIIAEMLDRFYFNCYTYDYLDSLEFDEGNWVGRIIACITKCGISHYLDDLKKIIEWDCDEEVVAEAKNLIKYIPVIWES